MIGPGGSAERDSGSGVDRAFDRARRAVREAAGLLDGTDGLEEADSDSDTEHLFGHLDWSGVGAFR